MDSLIIQQTEHTPLIILDKKLKEFRFEGRCLPENTVKFFKPVFVWIEEYKEKPLDDFKIDMNFIYFNTSSAKMLLEILRAFEIIYKLGYKVHVVWHYMVGDHDIRYAGEEYASMLSIPFVYKDHPESDYE